MALVDVELETLVFEPDAQTNNGIRTIARMDTIPKDTIPNEHLPSY